ncbi:hypothetical protein CERSUDRAFT_99693 [Gelatoporia subvermispora B]|uniref:Uncharacterized protein n=1 Tax=Ceriporiopsis subvermispora (strain B) TaxID=914234 RepID=M2R234_CERS8|nr:hypothetical protein CERSUDRAFT_99693 [Gelatoporia subvermispora B]
MAKKPHEAASKFTNAFPADQILKWQKMVDDWLLDHSNPDPYAEPPPSTTLATIRLELAREEAADATQIVASSSPSAPERPSPSTFIRFGIELEERQRKLRLRTDRPGGGDKKAASLQERRNVLTRHIQSWNVHQAFYMPGTLPPEASTPETTGDVLVHDPPEVTKVWLPSALSSDVQATSCCQGVADIERRLRRAQMEDALGEVRRMRRVYAGLLQRVKQNISGTGNKANTRSKTSIRAFTGKIKLAVERYRGARAALISLDPEGSWKDMFKELRKEDNCGPGREEDEQSEG